MTEDISTAKPVRQLMATLRKEGEEYEGARKFEERFNGAILPFLGVHACLLVCCLLRDARASAWLTGGAAIVVLSSLITRTTGKTQPLGVALATVLGMLAASAACAPFPALVATVWLFWMLLVVRFMRWVDDADVDTVLLYLPLALFAGPDAFEGFKSLVVLAAVLLYPPAIYLRFIHDPETGKAALGLSVLGFLVGVMDGTVVVVASLALAALLLFGGYQLLSTSRRRASAWVFFAGDSVIGGLWTVLFATLFHENSWQERMLWSAGIVIYQGIALLRLGYRQESVSTRTDGEQYEARRDAHWSWIFIAVLGGLLEPLGLLLKPFVAETFMAPYVLAALVLLGVFARAFYEIKPPLLTILHRLTTAATLVITLVCVQEDLDKSRAPVSFLVSWAALGLGVGSLSARRGEPSHHVKWWCGLMRLRHAALLQRGVDFTWARAKQLPLLGGFLTAFSGVVAWFRFASGLKSGFRTADYLVVGLHLYAVVGTSLFLTQGSLNDESTASGVLSSAFQLSHDPAQHLLQIGAWCFWGLILYVRGVVLNERVARFFSTYFIITPAILTYRFADAAGSLTSSTTQDLVMRTALLVGISLFALKPLRALPQFEIMAWSLARSASKRTAI